MYVMYYGCTHSEAIERYSCYSVCTHNAPWMDALDGRSLAYTLVRVYVCICMCVCV